MRDILARVPYLRKSLEAIYTDEWEAYRGVADGDTEHKTVKHSEGEYVKGDVHTNSLENVWSSLKRSIIGSYHQVSAKHLDAYLDELEFRYNNRENPTCSATRCSSSCWQRLCLTPN